MVAFPVLQDEIWDARLEDGSEKAVTRDPTATRKGGLASNSPVIYFKPRLLSTGLLSGFPNS
jgi:hypothetical protein